MIELKKAASQDCGRIHALQVEAFAELLEKYRDTESNPGAEPVEKVAARMAQDTTDYYFIQNEGSLIGAACVSGKRLRPGGGLAAQYDHCLL